jgi:hypothetical protein
LPESFTSALAQMLDVSLLTDPVFVLIGISNLFGMAGLYIPFVYLVDCAIKDVSEVQTKNHKLSNVIVFRASTVAKRRFYCP